MTKTKRRGSGRYRRKNGVPHEVKACEVLPFFHTENVCDRCGEELTGRRRRWCSKKCQEEFVANHRWTQSKIALKKKRKFCEHCGSDGNGKPLEVNHKIPRNGGGYGWGCWHHLKDLELLCHACHLVVTREQREARKLLATA